MKHVKLFEEFINEALNPKEFETAVKNLAYSMPNHTSYEDVPSDEQIMKAMQKYQKDLYKRSTSSQKKEAVEMVKQILSESNTNEASVDEMSHKDVHFKDIMQMYLKGGSFTKKKVASVVCKNPNASQKQIEDALEDADYNEIIEFEDELGIHEAIVNENWDAKDGKVLSNGKLIGYYSFDSDSDSFWVDDFKGKGQKSFEEKSEVIAYFKKHEKEALKALQNFKEVDESIVNEESSKKDLELQRIKLLNQAFKAMPNSPKQLKIREEIQKIESQIKELSEGVGIEVGDSATLKPNPGESEESFKIRTFSATVKDYEKFMTGKK